MTVRSDSSAYPRPAAGVHPPHTTGDYKSSRARHPKEPLVIIPHDYLEEDDAAIRAKLAPRLDEILAALFS